MYQECRHIKTSGTKCGAPALKGKAYCYFHFRANQFRHRQPGDRMEAFMNPKFQVALLEDRGAIQAAISETVHALAQDHMDHKRAGRILWGLHLAITNLKVPGEIVATEPVRALFQNEEGEEIGPEQIGYDKEDEVPENDGDELPENEGHELPKEKDCQDEHEANADQKEGNGGEADRDGREERTDGNDGGVKNSKADHHKKDGRPDEKQRAPNPTLNQTTTLESSKTLKQIITSYIADLRQKQPERYAKMVQQMLRSRVSSGT